MSRRQSTNRTGLRRLPGIEPHVAWASYQCAKCSKQNFVRSGTALLTPESAFQTATWTCTSCQFVHSRRAKLPFRTWPPAFRKANSPHAVRFWQGFFRAATEHPSSYWKQCNTCGRILPFTSFSKHVGWGPLARQMECRACKGAINAKLNPLRTSEQMHESSTRRRVADLLLEGENESVSHADLFKRFGSKCFKTGRRLSLTNRSTWAIDHILPSRYLYPMSTKNAALLSREANANKRDRWPSEFYSNSELIALAKITGANLELLASETPILNPKIDVNACVSRVLKVREHSNIKKRIGELKKLLRDYGLVAKLSKANRALLDL